MKRIFLFLSLCLLFIEALNAQESVIQYNVVAIGSYTSPSHVPFWLRSNKFGVIPLDNASMSFAGSVRKEYSSDKSRLFDWGAGFEGWTNVGNQSTFYLTEGYAKVRLSVFELKAGRSKDIMGLCDTSLSSGAFAVSGNALGIPKIEISIPEFYSIPVFGKLFAFKGNYVHGWIGDIPVNMLDGRADSLKTYLHQLSFYGRFGKPEWKLKLYGGINHQVQWGSEPKYYGSYYTLSDLECYWYVISGKAYGTNNIPTSKIGNHLGSIDMGLEYNFTNVRLYAYHQFFYDVGALYYLANVRDGLSGISLTNRKSSSDNSFKWNKILAEFFYSKNQAGEYWSPETPSGDENYYNNDTYVEGWSYKGIGVGNPFIGARYGIREELPDAPGDYFINNRVVAFHLGFEGSLQNWGFILKTSYTLNYGTYGTSEEGHSLGTTHYPPMYGIFPETKQFSSYLEVNKELKQRLKLGVIGAFDVGDLYYNSLGFQLRLSKSF
jgi:hypothetical protein